MTGERQGAMSFNERKVIALGEWNGVPGEAIAAAAETTGAEVVYTQTTTYVCASAGAMDLHVQKAIRQLASQHERVHLLVILGLTDVVGVETYARTVRTGDPSYAGSLTNVALNLDVIHVLDEEFRKAVPAGVWSRQVGPVTGFVDVQSLVDAARGRYRSRRA